MTAQGVGVPGVAVAPAAPEPEQFSCFVGDLAPDVNDLSLAQAFAQFYATVTSAKVITDPSTGRSKGYGFVRFSNEAERDRALEMQGFNLSGRPIRVSLATARRTGGSGSSAAASQAPHPAELDPTNTTLFIGGLSAGVSEDQLRAIFSQYGEIVYTKIPAGKGCGFVQFVERPAAEMAMAGLNGQVLGANAIRISWGRSTSRAPAARDAAAAAAAAAAFGAAGAGVYGLPPGAAAAAAAAAAGLGGMGAAYPGAAFGAGGAPYFNPSAMLGGGYAPAGYAMGLSAPMALPQAGGAGGVGLLPQQQAMALQSGGAPGAPGGAPQGANGVPPQLMSGYAPAGAGGGPTPGGMAFDQGTIDKMNAAFAARQQQQLLGGGGGHFLLPRQ